MFFKILDGKFFSRFSVSCFHSVLNAWKKMQGIIKLKIIKSYLFLWL